MQINVIEPLEWDSHFFGYPVARIVLDQKGNDKLDNIFKQIESEKFRVTYFFVPPSEKELNNRISKRGSILVDQKVAFSKTTEIHHNFFNNIIEYKGVEINRKLLELVLQAGTFSRFRLDGNFTNKEYERLYTEWLIKSIKKIIAFKILVAKKGFDTIGITTLSEKVHQANIDLVAVDRSFRGQGIGYDLIRSADTTAFKMGLNKIRVVTQLKNKEACKLYEKCNFHFERITNIYHYWQ